MNVFISNGRFQALCLLVARFLEIGVQQARQLIENGLAPEGRLTYEHLGRAKFEHFRDAARDLNVPMSFMIFEDLVTTLNLLTPTTPVCVNRECGEFTLQQNGAKYTPVLKGRCPWCTEIIEAKESAEVTHHLDWTSGASILVTTTVHRHFGPRAIPLTEQGIRATYPVSPGIEGLLQKRSITLVQFLNSLFCGSTAAQVPHPTDALAILGGTQKFALSDLDVVAYEAKSGPYKRTMVGTAIEQSTPPSTTSDDAKKVVLLCATADENYRTEIETQAAILEQQGKFKMWTAAKVLSGADRLEETVKAIQDADRVICLVSSNFLAKGQFLEWIDGLAFPKLQWVQVRPCVVWGTIFESIEALGGYGDDNAISTQSGSRDKHWKKVVGGILKS